MLPDWEADHVKLAVPWVDVVCADPDVASDSSEKSDLEDRAETPGAPVNPDDVEDCTCPVYGGKTPDDLDEGSATNAVPDRGIFATQGRLIGGSGSVDLDL